MGPIYDSVGKFCTDNWTERKRYQLMVQNKLLSTIQAYSLGFLTGNPMPWKRFCLFCLFHASLSIVDCSIQLVYTKFPNRVIYRAHRRFIVLVGCSALQMSLFICIIGHLRSQQLSRKTFSEEQITMPDIKETNESVPTKKTTRPKKMPYNQTFTSLVIDHAISFLTF